MNKYHSIMHTIGCGGSSPLCDGCTFDAMSADIAQIGEELALMRDRMTEVANDKCSCGGKGPDDEGSCEWCVIFHYVVGNKTT